MMKIANQLIDAGNALKQACSVMEDEDTEDETEEDGEESTDEPSLDDIGRKSMIISMKRKLNSK